ncbi:MAG TPA: hypothetical protein VIL64_00080 [Solirubrobacteraceae bacterium]|jgi:hypothetical protein
MIETTVALAGMALLDYDGPDDDPAPTRVTPLDHYVLQLHDDSAPEPEALDAAIFAALITP